MRHLVPLRTVFTHCASAAGTLWRQFEVAFQTRWQANIIINAPGTDGEALHAPLLELDTILAIKFDIN